MKTDNHLIARRFANASADYRQHASVQKNMATTLCQKLLPLIDATPRLAQRDVSILEIGCGTGLLTEQLLPHVAVGRYLANDLYAAADDYIAPLISPYTDAYQFIAGDATQLDLPHSVDIVVGGAVLQWIERPQQLFKQLLGQLSDDALLAFSGFAPGHYHEIKAITGQGLNYPTPTLLAQLAQPDYSVELLNVGEEKCFFDSPLSVLRHMQKTGVNAITPTLWQKRDLQHFISAYEAFKTDDGYPLTYRPLFLILQKKQVKT